MIGVLLFAATTFITAGLVAGQTPHGLFEATRTVLFEAIIVATVFGFALTPYSRPRPRRLSELIGGVIWRVAAAALVLLTISLAFSPLLMLPGHVIVTAGTLAIVLPIWFWSLRRKPNPERVLLVGDDPEKAMTLLGDLPVEPVGYVSSESNLVTRTIEEKLIDDSRETDDLPREKRLRSDGFGTPGSRLLGTNTESVLPRLGGLSRLQSICRTQDVDALALAFEDDDRDEFFGTLTVAYEHGLDAVVHESHSDSVLESGVTHGTAVEAIIDPWPWHTHVSKRAFDLCFALVGGMIVLPVAAAVAVAIKLESRGPVLYTQLRSALFGRRFWIPKARTMTVEPEDPMPASEGHRVTRVGRILRRTHMDEIPQLWSVFVGDMSAVGPRAVWTEEERVFEEQITGWRKRWYVKPGLTGLAQVNRVTSEQPRRKLELDLEYIERQSLLLDVRIVLMQFWIVLVDSVSFVRSGRE